MRYKASRERVIDSGFAHVEDAEQALLAIVADEGEDVRRRVKQFDTALDQRRMRFAKRQQRAIEFKHRAIDAVLGIDGVQQVFRRNREPGAVGGGKGAIGRMGLPDHWGAAAIAALELGPELDAVRINQILEGQFGLL